MIASITKRCNLSCKGCYSRVQHRSIEEELTSRQWVNVLKEARDLGISIVLIAGGEPFTRGEILDITGSFREVIFPIFTNGTLLSDEMIKRLKKQKNVLPVVSIEGFEKETDDRRGLGTFENVVNIIRKIKNSRIFFGVSITTTRSNFDVVTNEKFIRTLMDAGCRIFFFVEYVPVEEGSEELVLADAQRRSIINMMQEFRARFNRIFVVFPGDEEIFGGCLAAGRGFVHISPEGNLEPCPFAPYSDVNLKNISLKEALQSRFLNAIRQNHDKLTETKGGCALWDRRDWVYSLLRKSGT
jgi:MoaA/NifB/PqqE/SkfB family radical SAM enzyme